METFQKLPLESVCSFLTIQERINFSVASRDIFNRIEHTLISDFDDKVNYLNTRRAILDSNRRKKREKIACPIIQYNSSRYYLVKQQFMHFSKIMFKLAYTCECSTSTDNSKTFKNELEDFVIIPNSLLFNQIELKTNVFDIVHSSCDLNNIDFKDKNALLNRQKEILERLSKSNIENEIKADNNSL